MSVSAPGKPSYALSRRRVKTAALASTAKSAVTGAAAWRPSPPRRNPAAQLETKWKLPAQSYWPALVASGITHVFYVPGLRMFPLLDAIRKHRDQLSYFSGPNEAAVTLIAAGYGRAAGRPCTALAMMGVTTAWADRSPRVFTSTTSNRMLERRDQYASVPGDITDMARAYCKWSWEIPLVERIPDAIARAVVMATTPPMGPVPSGTADGQVLRQGGACADRWWPGCAGNNFLR